MEPSTPLIQTDVEDRILNLCMALEENVELFSRISSMRAEAEADFKLKYSRAIVHQTAKVTVSNKEAIAHLNSADDFRRWKLLEAQEKATQQAMTSIRSQLDALRTISANVRASGG